MCTSIELFLQALTVKKKEVLLKGGRHVVTLTHAERSFTMLLCITQHINNLV